VTGALQVEEVVVAMSRTVHSDDPAAIAVQDVLTIHMDIKADLGNIQVVC